MTIGTADTIVFSDVSKFYGEILGVNRINLRINPGITSLVGPNGAGKSTLMNLMTGLLRPTRGKISVLGITPDRPDELFRKVGYCGGFDSFPPGVTGKEFVSRYLSLHGFTGDRIAELTETALERVGMADVKGRRVASYSKGMRQRIRLAQAIAHRPTVLILDEPLNGLDPMARAETIDLFRRIADEGLHLVISSHILHEVDMMSDTVVLLNNGYIVAEGEIGEVRDEMEDRPTQILIRCDQPNILASRLFEAGLVVEARRIEDKKGLLLRTRDVDGFYLSLNSIVANGGIEIETVAVVDGDLNALYQYLIGTDGSSA